MQKYLLAILVASLSLTTVVLGQEAKVPENAVALQIAPNPLKRPTVIPLTGQGTDPLKDIILPKGPDDDVWDAAYYLYQIQKVESERGLIADPHTSIASRIRFLSFYNYPTKGKRLDKGVEVEYSPLAEALIYINKSVNDVNFKNPAFAVTQVSDTLVAISLDSPGWNSASWEILAGQDPYFRREWVSNVNWDYLRWATCSEHPIMRADQFMVLSSLPPHYYNLLGFPKTLTDFKTLIGLQEDLNASLLKDKAGAVTSNLTVTLNNRRLVHLEGIIPMWSSLDTLNSSGSKNVLQQLGKVGGTVEEKKKHELDVDGQEHIIELGWGGFAGFLSDKQGNRVDFVPVEIAIDPNFRDRKVFAGRSCLVCHEQYVKPFKSDLAHLTKSGIINLGTITDDDRLRLQSFYDEQKVQRILQRDMEDYVESLSHLMPWTPEKSAQYLKETHLNYVESRVTLDVAAREMGASIDQATAVLVPSLNPNLLMLITKNPDTQATQTIPRDTWENVFHQAMLLKGPPTERAEREKFNLEAIRTESAYSVDTREIVFKAVSNTPQKATITVTGPTGIKWVSFEDQGMTATPTQKDAKTLVIDIIYDTKTAKVRPTKFKGQFEPNPTWVEIPIRFE
jgi:hypothetical protein